MPTLFPMALLTWAQVTISPSRVSPSLLTHMSCLSLWSSSRWSVTELYILKTKSLSSLTQGEYWGDGTTFRPERFLNTEGKCVKDERLIPFSIGDIQIFNLQYNSAPRAAAVPGGDAGQDWTVSLLHWDCPALLHTARGGRTATFRGQQKDILNITNNISFRNTPTASPFCQDLLSSGSQHDHNITTRRQRPIEKNEEKIFNLFEYN